MKEYEAFIYCLIDPRTNQIRYIGKAKNPSDRYRNHINSSRDKNTHKRNWINNMRKEGVRPELLILDSVSSKEWIFWERFYIGLYRSYGFNLVNHTEGGDGSTYGNITSFKKGNLPWNKGTTISEEARGKISSSLKGKRSTWSWKPIIQYDLEYNMIKRYSSIEEAVSNNKSFISSKICSCCRLKRKTHGGYIWRYESDQDLIKNIHVRKKGKGVIKYDLEFNEISRYKSLILAAEDNNIPNTSGIFECCNGRRKKSSGFIWRYDET